MRAPAWSISFVFVAACASTPVQPLCENPAEPAPVEAAIAEPIDEEGIVRARWIARGDVHDFEWLESRIHVRLEQDPRNLDHWAELARLHVDRAVRDEDPDALGQVALILAQADRVGGESARLELVRGLLEQLRDRNDRAVAIWQHAVDLDPTLVEARLRLGMACLEHRDFARAAVQLEAYLELEPDGADGWLALGVAYVHGGEREAARAAYERAAELAPEDPRPHWNLALMNQYLGEAEQDDLLDQQRRSLEHLDDLFEIIEEHPLPECEPVFFPDPQCLAAHRQREQLVIDATELDAITQDVVAAIVWHPPGPSVRDLAAQAEKAEAERRKKLLELEERAAAAAGTGER